MSHEIKERPILFSGAMVRALLDGSKTQTRRPVKDDPGPYWHPVVGLYNPVVIANGGYEAPGPEIYGAADENQGRKCPYGQPGDYLWVRETWAPHPDFPETVRRSVYRADPECEYDVPRWRPSIHMPRWASRILLEIVSVRVERLQDISEADAGAEGALEWARRAEGVKNVPSLMNVGLFSKLWEQTYGPGSWEANPWVWVVEFKRSAS